MLILFYIILWLVCGVIGTKIIVDSARSIKFSSCYFLTILGPLAIIVGLGLSLELILPKVNFLEKRWFFKDKHND